MEVGVGRTEAELGVGRGERKMEGGVGSGGGGRGWIVSGSREKVLDR